MTGKVIKESGTKGLFWIALLLLLVASIGLGVTLTGFMLGERGVAKERPAPMAREEVQEQAQEQARTWGVPAVEVAPAVEGTGITGVPGVAEAVRVASSDYVDPIDQILSTPSPYETKLTGSEPQKRRPATVTQSTAQKKRPERKGGKAANSPGEPSASSVKTGKTGKTGEAASRKPDEAKASADKSLQEEGKASGASDGASPASGSDEPLDSPEQGDEGASATSLQAEDKAAAKVDETEESKKTKVHLFGTVALFPKPITAKSAPQWYRVMMTQQTPPPIFSKGTAKRMPAAVAKRWFALREKIDNADKLTKLKEVNKFFNTWPYRTDDVVWGVPEYWATPEEFLEKSGDCEDYAITKYYALRSLGFSANEMRIVAVKETIRGIGHAVLAVFHNDTAYILDNLSPYVLEHTVLKNYRPQFSVNENYRWGHARIVKKK